MAGRPHTMTIWYLSRINTITVDHEPNNGEKNCRAKNNSVRTEIMLAVYIFTLSAVWRKFSWAWSMRTVSSFVCFSSASFAADTSWTRSTETYIRLSREGFIVKLRSSAISASFILLFRWSSDSTLSRCSPERRLAFGVCVEYFMQYPA